MSRFKHEVRVDRMSMVSILTLGEMSREGWELVAVHITPGGDAASYWKRPVRNNK